jgi:hypothetical protein
LKGENKMDFKIIATDFDGTLCEDKWPDIGEPNEQIIRYLKEQKVAGAKIILWTCRVKNKLYEAVDWCCEHGLTFDAVNANIPEVINYFGTDSRKVFAHEYIDDRFCTEFQFPFVKTGITDKIIEKLERVFGFPHHGQQYNFLFRGYLQDINSKLIAAGFNTNAKSKNCCFTDEDIKVIETFITKDGPVMEFKEIQALVNMQYEIYKRMMAPTYIINNQV